MLHVEMSKYMEDNDDNYLFKSTNNENITFKFVSYLYLIFTEDILFSFNCLKNMFK